ncbi:MAG: Crp/Fnr family transcriptional regulator [Pirellulaceae bacterium]
MTKLIGLRRKRIERRLKSLLFRNNRDRLTHLLTELAEQYGNATTEGIELGLRLSHQDLASIIGATRETVTTLLGEMQSEGLVKIHRQRLVVLDIPRLGASLNGNALPGLEKATNDGARKREALLPRSRLSH